MSMQVETSSMGDAFVAHLSGKMAFSDNVTFRSLVEKINGSGAKRCTFELAGLQSVDSAGLGMFVIALEAAKKNGWSLTLRKPSGQVKQLLALARFDKLLTIAD
jgi:anti-anti-sigma factor